MPKAVYMTEIRRISGTLNFSAGIPKLLLVCQQPVSIEERVKHSEGISDRRLPVQFLVSQALDSQLLRELQIVFAKLSVNFLFCHRFSVAT